MLFGSYLERLATLLLVLSVGVIVSGTNACQENYEFAPNASTGTGTGTATVTATNITTAVTTITTTVTTTVTPLITGTVTDTALPVFSATISVDLSPTAASASGAGGLFNELSALDEEKKNKAPIPSSGVGGSQKVDNWLGQAFSKDGESSWHDSDGDGFSDVFEESAGSDPQDPLSMPRDVSGTALDARVSRQEVEAVSDKAADPENDSDGDGVSDEIEKERGMNPQSVDSDQDGLSDPRELVVGSNPIKSDTDGDGISDGREFEQGTDPTLPESKHAAE